VPCCQAEKYKWCKGLRSVWISKDNKEYCVFHAPKEHKGQNRESFNKLVYAKVQEGIYKETECDLSGSIFPWPIDFSQFNQDNPFPPINFRDVIFQDYADFKQTIFSGVAFFMKVSFMGEAFFGQATFMKDACFWQANFKESALFERAFFRRAAFFMDAHFIGEAHFGEAVFGGARHKEGNFRGGGANFLRAAFSGNVNFRKVSFSSIVNLEEAIFSKNVYFEKTKFQDRLYLGWCSPKESIFFEGVDLNNVYFLDSDPLKMHFIGCTWPQRFGRKVLSDEIHPIGKKPSFEKIEYFYRRLKQKYKIEYNEAEASQWHYGEKEMFRKKKWWRRYNPFSFSNLYWVSSGYGERPVRAGSILILIFIAVTVLMNLLGLVPRHGNPVFGVESIKGFSDIFHANKFWLLISNTIQHALFMRDTYFIPQSLAGSIILTLSTKLIIPIQTALFVLALRNKFRR
jgi:uncharacterized protein YjbI with pentapeptide repeats